VDQDDFASLLTRAEAGDPVAMRALQQVERDIRLMVRIRLPRALRPQFDSMDFVQDVWQSFFRVFHDNPDRFANTDFLRRFLAGMARNKVLEEHRRRTLGQKYDVRREEPLYIKRGDREIPREIVAQGPSPVEDAQARERVAQLVEGRSPIEAEIIKLRLSGVTFDEIARRTGLHERSVRRVLETVRNRIRVQEESSAAE
jgi:RNA polymerase sigma-70 factor (ECF subfamily)